MLQVLWIIQEEQAKIIKNGSPVKKKQQNKK